MAVKLIARKGVNSPGANGFFEEIKLFLIFLQLTHSLQRILKAFRIFLFL